MAQSAHAATTVLHLNSDHPDVRAYLAGEDGKAWKGMRKAVLEVDSANAQRFLLHC